MVALVFPTHTQIVTSHWLPVQVHPPIPPYYVAQALITYPSSMLESRRREVDIARSQGEYGWTSMERGYMYYKE